MELVTKERTVAASRQKYGIEILEIEPGQTLKIETSPNGAEILSELCPVGCNWSVQISVIINETDA